MNRRLLCIPLIVGLLMTAACDEGDPLGVSPNPSPGDTTKKPPASVQDFAVWVKVPGTNTVGLNTQINREAGYIELPDTVCWSGRFNNWARDCKVWSTKTRGDGFDVYPLPATEAVMSLAASHGTVGKCERVTYYWKRFPAQYFPVEEWVFARGGLGGLTTQQKAALAADPNSGRPVDQRTGSGLLPTVMLSSAGSVGCIVGG